MNRRLAMIQKTTYKTPDRPLMQIEAVKVFSVSSASGIKHGGAYSYRFIKTCFCWFGNLICNPGNCSCNFGGCSCNLGNCFCYLGNCFHDLGSCSCNFGSCSCNLGNCFCYSAERIHDRAERIHDCAERICDRAETIHDRAEIISDHAERIHECAEIISECASNKSTAIKWFREYAFMFSLLFSYITLLPAPFCYYAICNCNYIQGFNFAGINSGPFGIKIFLPDYRKTLFGKIGETACGRLPP